MSALRTTTTAAAAAASLRCIKILLVSLAGRPASGLRRRLAAFPNPSPVSPPDPRRRRPRSLSPAPPPPPIPDIFIFVDETMETDKYPGRVATRRAASHSADVPPCRFLEQLRPAGRDSRPARTPPSIWIMQLSRLLNSDDTRRVVTSWARRGRRTSPAAVSVCPLRRRPVPVVDLSPHVTTDRQ